MPADSYCDAAEIKASMPDTQWGNTYDSLLNVMAGRASRVIDVYTGRHPGAFKVTADDTLYLSGDGSSDIWVELAQAPTSVSVAETGDLTSYTLWAANDYVLWPYNAILFGEPFQKLEINPFGNKIYWPIYPKCIKIVGRFGFSLTPPEPIIEATIIQASRWYKRGQQAWQDTGAISDLGQLTYTKRLDPDVAEIIDHYRRLTV